MIPLNQGERQRHEGTRESYVFCTLALSHRVLLYAWPNHIAAKEGYLK
jgi:hypothetical protein